MAFFAELLVHTKGRWARRAFDLEPWQEWDIIRPLFGEVIWSDEVRAYVRRYRIAYIVLGRKNGKTELAAGIVLYLLVGDDEESAEVYGAARDTKQAGKVADVVQRMRQLSPTLAARLGWNKATRRIFDLSTASYYEVITADAMGELGSNPHGTVIDEVLSQRDDSLWNAMRTAMGARSQPLMLAITTETNDPSGFGAHQIDEAEKVVDSPASMPHVFAYVRKLPRTDHELAQLCRRHKGHPDLPVSCDPWDEANWRWPNPALGSFLSLASLREEAMEARADPSKENPFRQFRCNQRVQQVSRWMPLHLWDASAGMVPDDLPGGSVAFAGLDLASTTDLACWCLLFPSDGRFQVLWRFWVPEAQLPRLDEYTGGQASVWARQGLLRTTEGDWIDYDAIKAQVRADRARYRLVRVGYDPAEATEMAQWMIKEGLEVEQIRQGYNLSEALKEMMRLVGAQAFRHGGHPVARWNADAVEVRRNDEDQLKIVKPDRAQAKARIDGIAAAATAIKVWQAHVATPEAVPLVAWR